MKKIVPLALICATIFLMPAISALSIKTNINYERKIPPLPDYDGTFLGGYGRMYKENEEWQFEYHGYLGGVYRDNNKNKILYGNIYNLEKEQIGKITFITAKSFLIGRIKNMDDRGVPIVGFFLIREDDLFAGRLMSFFGPAPHIWGKFTPN